MPERFLLSHAQMRRIEPFFPRSRGLPRVDGRRIVSNWFRAVLPPELPRQASDPSHSARQAVHEHLHQRAIDGVDEANASGVNSFSAVARYPADLQRW